LPSKAGQKKDFRFYPAAFHLWFFVQQYHNGYIFLVSIFLMKGGNIKLNIVFVFIRENSCYLSADKGKLVAKKLCAPMFLCG
jgi:hypothetical protein